MLIRIIKPPIISGVLFFIVSACTIIDDSDYETFPDLQLMEIWVPEVNVRANITMEANTITMFWPPETNIVYNVFNKSVSKSIYTFEGEKVSAIEHLDANGLALRSTSFTYNGAYLLERKIIYSDSVSITESYEYRDDQLFSFRRTEKSEAGDKMIVMNKSIQDLSYAGVIDYTPGFPLKDDNPNNPNNLNGFLIYVLYTDPGLGESYELTRNIKYDTDTFGLQLMIRREEFRPSASLPVEQSRFFIDYYSKSKEGQEVYNCGPVSYIYYDENIILSDESNFHFFTQVIMRLFDHSFEYKVDCEPENIGNNDTRYNGIMSDVLFKYGLQ